MTVGTDHYNVLETNVIVDVTSIIIIVRISMFSEPRPTILLYLRRMSAGPPI